MGTITGISGAGRPIVCVDGDADEDARETKAVKGISPVVNDRAFLEYQGGQYIVIATMEAVK